MNIKFKRLTEVEKLEIEKNITARVTLAWRPNYGRYLV